MNEDEILTPLLRRALLVLVVIEHVAFIVAPLDVLAPVRAGRIGRLLLHGRVPYRDFGFEYPPLAALAFLLPGLSPGPAARSMLAVQAVVLEAVVVVVVLRRASSGATLRYALLSLFLFPFLSGGFDAFPMAALAISTFWLAEGDARGWWAAAVGAATKVVPGVASAWSRTRPRQAIAALTVAGALLVLPVLLTTKTDNSYIGFTLHRGVQIESVAGTTAWLSKAIHGGHTHFRYRYRSWEITGASGFAAAWAGLAALGFVIVARRARHVDPWTVALLCTLLFLIGNKVLSPQYLAWGAPVAAIVGGRPFRAYLVAAALTFGAYSIGGSGSSLLAVIAARNLVLVGMAAAALVQLLHPRPGPVHLRPEVVE